jgi:hypothetical protein
VGVHKAKPPLSSPTFEKLNQERLKQSRDNSDTAKRAVGKAEQLVHQSKELIARLRDRNRKAG